MTAREELAQSLRICRADRAQLAADLSASRSEAARLRSELAQALRELDDARRDAGYEAGEPRAPRPSQRLVVVVPERLPGLVWHQYPNVYPDEPAVWWAEPPQGVRLHSYR